MTGISLLQMDFARDGDIAIRFLREVIARGSGLAAALDDQAMTLLRRRSYASARLSFAEKNIPPCGSTPNADGRRWGRDQISRA